MNSRNCSAFNAILQHKQGAWRKSLTYPTQGAFCGVVLELFNMFDMSFALSLVYAFFSSPNRWTRYTQISSVATQAFYPHISFNLSMEWLYSILIHVDKSQTTYRAYPLVEHNAHIYMCKYPFFRDGLPIHTCQTRVFFPSLRTETVTFTPFNIPFSPWG